MFTYEVAKSFWVKDGDDTHWSTAAYGREGVSIPPSILLEHEVITVIVNNRGTIYTLDTELARHHGQWHSVQDGSPVIIPVQLMTFKGLTEAQQEKKKAQALAKKRQMKKLTKTFCIALFERVRKQFKPKTLLRLQELIEENYPEDAKMARGKQQAIWISTVQDYMGDLRGIEEWNKPFQS